jgi:hypothetical protein
MPAPVEEPQIGELLTIEDVMRISRLGKSSVKAEVREGLLEATYFHGTTLRFRREWVDAWIDSWPQEPAA